MKIEELLRGVKRLFLDTAPVVYFVEQNPEFIARVAPVFDRLDLDIIAVISSITLAECLVFPIKRGFTDLEKAFEEILNSERVEFVATDREIANLAARIRAK
jgi:predicted nucleic acid-binding protein